MTTFVLVHGAWHGAWCWDLVAAELRMRGGTAVAPDLPTEDPAAGASEYADVVLDGFNSTADEIVLVGHSAAGLTVPVVAERLADADRPPRRLVLLAPMLPVPGRSHEEMHRHEPDRLMPGLAAGQDTRDDGASAWQPQAAIATMYPDAPPSVAEWAARRLRPQQWRVTREVTPLRRWPAVDTTVVACTGDGVVNPDWVRRSAPIRFGREARLIAGDHAPFLARPAELADLLLSTV